MPFPQIAKDNLVVALSLANVFTDARLQYPSLSDQARAITELQRYIAWQIHHSYFSAEAGMNTAKRTLASYIHLDSSVDLFMRYMDIPACKPQTNLAYLDENIQKLIYLHFKDRVLRKSFFEPIPPSEKMVAEEVRAVVKEMVLGYATKPSEQKPEERIFPTDEDWQVFVAEVDVGIEKLVKQHDAVIKQFHKEFAGFRDGQLQFMLNFFDRCSFLNRLESWLKQVPEERNHPAAEDSRISVFLECLEELKHSHKEIDLHYLRATLDHLKTRTLSQSHYKLVVTVLISLKAKYDTYCRGQDKMSAKDLQENFMEAWPKPKLLRWEHPRPDKENDHVWKAMRQQHRELEVADSKDADQKRKLPFGKRMGLTAAS
jgi:hypothetical protein